MNLIGHEPTIRYFDKLGLERERFIQDSISSNVNLIGDATKATIHIVLAGWAYDLVSSRALQGPFGRGGKVRLAILSTVLSLALAVIAPLVLIATDNGMHELTLLELVETAIPLLISSLYLISTLLRSRKEPELAMLPWIDIANHKSQSRLNLEYGLLGDEIIIKKDGAASPLSSSAIGEEEAQFVNFDYGGASQGAGNNKLLGIYGFVEEDNPNDTMNIQIGGKSKRIITIGRKGVVHTPLSNEEDCTLDEVIYAASDLRGKFLELDQMHDCTKISDPIEYQRSWLAAQWRKEKIRLINEFLS